MSSQATALLEAKAPAATPRLRWWREALIIAAFYGVYTIIRDEYTSSGGRDDAQANARGIIHVERDLHLFSEQQIQHWILEWHWQFFIEFWNTWYGTAHFVAVGGVLIYLYHKRSNRYPLWRNTFAVMNLIALLGFAFFPLMPPRLLPASYHFVDTLAHYGSPWNFSSGPAAEASNQFAAMPSMHTGWSTWCAVALVPTIKPRWGKVAIFLYPLATVFCIVVTGNHYFLDAVGGLVALGLAYLIARPLTAWWAARTWLQTRPRQEAEPCAS